MAGMRQHDHASDDESRERQGYDRAHGGEDVQVPHRLVRDRLQPQARCVGPGGEDDGGFNQLGARHRAALQKSNAGANEASGGPAQRA